MASRNELAMRARVVGLDASTIPNDSKLEQKILWLEKRASPLTGTAAQTTLTSDTTAPSDGDTVTIGAPLSSRTYTFKTALTSPAVANEVLIGASAAVALDNLKAAVTRTGTPGTDYSANTPLHPSVDATTNTDTTQLFVARDTNAGDDFVSTETSSHLSFPGATFHSGTPGVAGVIAAGTTTTGDGQGVSGDRNTSV